MTQYLFRFWVPLSNFHAERLPIRLREDLEIIKASAFENDLLSQLKSKWTNLRFSDLLLRLSLKKQQPEAEPDIYLPDARRDIEKAITIFRLFKAQVTGFNLIIQQYSDDALYAYSANALLHYMLWATPDSRLAREPYSLREHEIDTFISFFRTYDTPTMSKIALAIAYFNKSYIEPYTPRDSFLDLMICLENLFLKKTEQELAYKLSMRMAHLLGEDTEERVKVFHLIKDAYHRRSKIVHGSSIKGLSEEYLFEVRAMARRALKYLLKNISLWPGAEQDKVILSGTFYPNHNVEQSS